jgi:hypothetical protein
LDALVRCGALARVAISAESAPSVMTAQAGQGWSDADFTLYMRFLICRWQKWVIVASAPLKCSDRINAALRSSLLSRVMSRAQFLYDTRDGHRRAASALAR